ncbi:MAG: hypothetical protein HY042_03970, partial [Spirochaetia bacterium]|nr:hypothetical protein [Spirochaetia bacterium]
YYVYYVSLGTLHDPKLESRLKSMSSQVKMVETKKGGTPGQETGLDNVSKDIAYTSWFGPIQKFLKANWMWVAAALGGLIILWVLFLLIKKFRNRYKVAGKILYYEDGVSFPMKSEYTLGKLNAPVFSIGSPIGSNLRIKTLGVAQKFSFRAKAAKGENYLVPVGKPASLIKYVAQKSKGLLSNGDKFKIGNFIFEYTDGTEKAKR